MATLFAPAFELPPALQALTNLADARIGAKSIQCSDSFFAPVERMLQFEAAIFVEDKFDDHGKWMDGWETRRKREVGHDWAIVQLGVAGQICAVDIDTSFFSGNYPAAASVDACYIEDASDQDFEQVTWHSLLPNQELGPNQHHILPVSCDQVFSHVRLNIFPDGGIARFRVYGQVHRAQHQANQVLDRLALENGGRVIAYSDAHFGHPRHLILPGRGINMGDGWETKRRRAPGYDWCILALGQRAHIQQIDIDTAHFKGNYPAQVSIQAIHVQDASDTQLIAQSMFWPYLLPAQPMQMDHVHEYIEPILAHQQISHIRINMIPDGGISRVRLWGKLVSTADES